MTEPHDIETDRPAIYTEKTECRDCYKCLRQCTVKAIRIRDGHATVELDRCVLCGHCVEACPAGAKRIRDDIDDARAVLADRPATYVSLAPSWVSEFPDLTVDQIVAGIRALGFAGASETALGAERVSAAVGRLLAQGEKKVYISSACPVVVELIRKHHPEHADRVTELFSPLLAHGQLLRSEYGPDIGVVFVGPCIAKKREIDRQGGLVETALTFAELRRWWQMAGIDPAELPAAGGDGFVPDRAATGAMYPVDGGMLAGVQAGCEVADAHYMAFSGIGAITEALAELETIQPDRPVFLELLACEGGCVNGPGMRTRVGTVAKRFEVLRKTDRTVASRIAVSDQDRLEARWDIEPVRPTRHSPEAIAEALRQVGKTTPEDELNCGSCGYSDCRTFAAALLDGRAETDMCLGYMRKLATQKAAALIRTMPSGVVIVDEALHVVDSNRRFAEMMGPDAVLGFEAREGMEGASLEKLCPFAGYFREILAGSGETVERDMHVGDTILHATIFAIEPGRLVGGVLQDITAPAGQKDRIARRAREVIRKQLETVQQVAYLLGENAAESEAMLQRIIEGFGTDASAGPAGPADGGGDGR